MKNDVKKTNQSIVDEFNRNKRIFKKLKFKSNDREFIWKCFIATFKKTFHIVNRELEKGIKFNLKTGAVFSEYELEVFDVSKKMLQIKWKNGNDKYWMKFQLRKKYIWFGSVIKVTEHIYRSTPFWGLQDTAGLMWLKKNFKNEMKNFKKSIEIVMENNGEIPNDLSKFDEVKTISKSKKTSNPNFDLLVNSFCNYFKIKKINDKFTSKINKNSIVYFLDEYNELKKNIKIHWNQNSDLYHLNLEIKNNKLLIEQSVSTIWGNDQKSKFKLIKKNFLETFDEIYKAMK